MPENLGKAATVGEIARSVAQPLHRVTYLIRARGIRPTLRVGNLRLFGEKDVEFIKRELRRIDVAREEGVRRER